MKVLVINCGSSSLKYQVLDMDGENLLAKGLVERIGMDGSVITHTKIGSDDKWKNEVPMPTHKEAIEQVLNAIVDPEHGVLHDMSELGAVGHRVVHGGERYANSVLIDEEVLTHLDELSELAPLHNPANILGIRACQKLMPNTPMVAVFDTAFHQTMPAESYIYALPYEYYEKYGVRRYGFHGTSHKYVADRASKMMNVSLDDMKIITCHLGNGASVAAIKRGKCIDTSMGFTPLEGLVMGTRCGDIDPSITTYISEKEQLSAEEMNEVMNKKSGVLGISGISSDFRDIEAAAEEGNERAQLALKVFAHKVRAYIGAFIAEMNGLDALVFTAGVGENDISMRDIICNDLGNLGIKLDLVKNKIRGKEAIISRDDSPVTIMLIPTNEELMIARDTVEIVEKNRK
ncbi:MAG: acetate kinase [Eubacterium sp.]|jgi:acetate kinase|nr:acetate kinase [Eubacterium sp.]MCH4046173.1 acetate kinase [Eubacterium sp.]MCH4079268.1 acetate kinase [Eubacterium sp.]MCH4110492.1 acetate kinase [Eubacterium sp.]MCI1307863.1 acetate kinase [Eubacterium sp.]